MVTLYGIKNCDTVKKAQKWLENQGIAWQLHDYRRDGVDAPLLHNFVAELGWEALLNRRGTTWRQLDEAQRAAVNDADSAIALMLEKPAIIKRPLLWTPGKPMLLGFSESTYQQYFNEV